MASNEDYLWNREAPVDPDVERLERLLSPFAFEPRTLPLAPRSRPRWIRLAPIAAAAALAIGGGVWLVLTRPLWRVEPVAGRPLLGSRLLESLRELPLGETLETDDRSVARIHVGRLGSVVVHEGSRVRLATLGRREQRLALDRGTIVATITAPPRLFIVETRAALAIDLGCAYRLQVDESGSGTLQVTDGWVQLDGGTREAIVPAGASATIRAGVGPGTPVFDSAPAEMKAALERLDFESEEPSVRAKALQDVVRAAERRDALTLLTLLWRVRADERGLVYDGLAAVLPPPPGVTRESIISGDREMLNRWWEVLPLPRLSKKKFLIWPL